MNRSIPKTAPLALATPLDHHSLLHHAPHGTVIYWQRQAAQAWRKVSPTDPVPQLVMPMAGKGDTFVSVNQFSGWRLVRLLRSLRACYVDIDGYTDLLGALDALSEARMPAPSCAVYSGRGLHLYWLLEPVPAQALPVWQRIQNALIAVLQPLGADTKAKDCTRVLRLVGSRHSGTDAMVEGRIVTGDRWPLSDLANEVLGERRPRTAATVRDIRPKQKQRRPAAGGSIYERWHLVYRDLLTIAEHHWFGGVPEGHRDTWLFLTSVALSWFAHPDTLAAEIEAQGRAWVPSWTVEDVRRQMAPVIERARRAGEGELIEWQGQMVDPRYRFRRSTLWEWSADMIPPELLPQLRAIIPDELAAERKREQRQQWAAQHRYSDSYTGKGVRASNEEKRTTARLMAAQGQSQTAIAKALGVGRRTVQRWIA